MATIALDVKINALDSAKTLKELKTGIKDLNNEVSFARKDPDFYWPEKDIIIEVAGLDDNQGFDNNYTYKLKKSIFF